MFYDITTSNTSFIDTAICLKSKGVQNWKFMLMINDINLIGVDPYDPDLTEDQKRSICRESTINVWYYLREVIRLPEQDGGLTKYELNLANVAQVFLFLRNQSSWVTIPYGLKSEIDTIALLSWPRLNNSTKRVVSVTKILVENIVGRMDQVVVPSYLQPPVYADSSMVITTPQCDSPGAAKAVARGMSQQIVWYSEAEYIKYLRIMHKVSSPIRLEIYNKCSANNDYTATLYTSTVCNDDNGAIEILNNSIQWYECFFDKDFIISKQRLFHIKYSGKDLGKDEKWYAEIAATLRNESIVRRAILLERDTTPDTSV